MKVTPVSWTTSTQSYGHLYSSPLCTPVPYLWTRDNNSSLPLVKHTTMVVMGTTRNTKGTVTSPCSESEEYDETHWGVSEYDEDTLRRKDRTKLDDLQSSLPTHVIQWQLHSAHQAVQEFCKDHCARWMLKGLKSASQQLFLWTQKP